MTSLPLAGVQVLDLTRVLSGPFATQQLIDLGARVVKIEHPDGGDDTRRFGPPFVNGESTYFMSANRGKESVAIDLKAPAGLDLVRRLVAESDVLIENFRPGTLTRLGLDLTALREAQPALITCSISGYGASGDPEYAGRAGYDAIVQASSGLMALTGAPDGPPYRFGVAIADLASGLFAAQGILAALYARSESGRGAHVDISMQDTMAALLTYQAGIYFATGQNPPRLGNAHPSICPYESLAVEDGAFMLAVGNDAQFAKLCAVLDRPELAEDARFAQNAARVTHREALMAILRPRFLERSGAEWDRLLNARGIPCGPILSVAAALEHPQLRARGSVLTHSHPSAGAVRSVATPVRFDETAPGPVAAPPRLGEHTAAVLRERLGLDEAAIETLATAGVLGQISR